MARSSCCRAAAQKCAAAQECTAAQICEAEGESDIAAWLLPRICRAAADFLLRLLDRGRYRGVCCFNEGERWGLFCWGMFC